MSNLTSRKIYSRIASVFILLTLAALGLIFHITLATATIHMKSATENFVFNGPLEISDIDTKTTASVELDGQSEFSVSGKVTTSDKAGINVTITNNTKKAQPLVATTRFLTSEGLIFRLQKGLTVPASGSIAAFIEADETGDQYLVPAGRFTIPGLATSLQSQIYGESQTAATFERIQSNIVTQKDVDQATTELIQKMMPAAIAELKKAITIDRKENIIAEILESEPDVAIGEGAEKFLLKGKIQFSYIPIDQDMLRQRATEALKRKLPDSMTIKQANDDTFSYQLNKDGDQISADGHLEATISKSNDWAGTIDLNRLHGLSAYEGEKLLQQEGLPVTKISLWPFWIRKIPKLNDHINIVTED